MAHAFCNYFVKDLLSLAWITAYRPGPNQHGLIFIPDKSPWHCILGEALYIWHTTSWCEFGLVQTPAVHTDISYVILFTPKCTFPIDVLFQRGVPWVLFLAFFTFHDPPVLLYPNKVIDDTDIFCAWEQMSVQWQSSNFAENCILTS